MSDNRRIAKNTMYLYIRMTIIMLITLYTSRIVLAQLGVIDYGVYTVVGGVISMFSFLNSSMATSTQRFLNYEMGKSGENSDKVKNIFSTSLLIHIILALIIVLFAETLGLWFLNTQLVIPPTSMSGARIIYQTAIISFCFTILRVPFNASIIAHEKMQVYAIISIVEALLLLSIAFLLSVLPDNKLVWYGVMIMATQFLIMTTYFIIASKLFVECRFRVKYMPNLFKEMAKFAGWNMFGSIAWLARVQGMGIVLNMFLGPALNAAKGIADQVSGAVHSLTNNFQVALNPQITKSYAQNEIREMQLLTYRGIKFACILIWIVALPIIINVDTILDLWLTDVPKYASIFVILILFDSLTGTCFGTPLMTAMSATGVIKTYQVVVSLILLLIIPISYCALKLGLVPESIFYFNIIVNFVAGIVRLLFCKKKIGFSISQYFKYAFLPVFFVLVLSSILAVIPVYALHSFSQMHRIESLLMTATFSFICVCLLSWAIALDKTERIGVKNMIKARFIKFNQHS